MRVEDAACVVCGEGPGVLTIEIKMVAKPLGSFSLSGGQLKFPATQLPVLECSACGLHLVGKFSANGRQFEFPNPVRGGDGRADGDTAVSGGGRSGGRY